MLLKYKAFISCSFNKDDEKIINTIKNFAESLGFIPYIANDGHSKAPIEKVKAEILEADCLIAICTKKAKIERTSDWKTSDWILNEIGMAVMAKKPLIAFVESGVKIHGILPNITSYKEFERENLHNNTTELIEVLFNLYAEIQRDNIQENDLSISFIRNDIIYKSEIFADGGNEIITEVELLSLENYFNTATHRAYVEASGDISIRALDFQFYPLSTDRNIMHSFKINKDKEVLLIVEFDPPLNINDTVKYGFRKKSLKANVMSLEEIKKMIEIGQYPIDEAYDFEGVLVNTPTKHFRREITFPRGFKISNIKFDVYIGRSNNRDNEEYLRIKQNKFFKQELFGEAWRIYLDVINPRMGCCYCIFWQPPKEEDFLLCEFSKKS